ncbi:transcriptional regulator [Ihubacter massiliensis]|uniref:transcriptional regulator n=1 Tax=Ihubacter massiliensis TaxID=1852367 RepID=UPI00345C0E3B
MNRLETSEKTYYTVDEVKTLMGVAETKAYGIIKQLNKELEDKGYITVRGKVSKKYFNERFYGGNV